MRIAKSPGDNAAGLDTPSRNGLLWRAAVLLLVFLLGCFDMADPDIWWHLRTGQLIWERGAAPRTDWYTYTNPDAAWIDLHWGFQLAAAALWALGGSAALILAKSVVGAAAVGICLTVERRGWPVWQTAACWLAPILIFSSRYDVRPEVVTLLLLAATLAIAHHAPARPRLLWLLPLVQLAWVNLHGLFALQFVVLTCVLVDALASRWWRWGTDAAVHGPFRWKSWMAATVASGAASLANPYGIQGVLFPLILLRRVQGPDREFYHRFSDELKGVDDLLAERGLPGLVEDATSILLLVVAMLVAATFALLLTQRRFNLYRAMLFAAFAYLAWQMTRNCVLFAVGAGVVLRLNVGELVEASRGMARRSAGDHGAPRGVVPPARRWPEAATAVALGLLVVSIPSGAYHRVRSAWPTRKLHLGEAAWHAHSAAEFLNRPGFPRCIYAAHEGVAAVCIYHLAPQRRVFADPRLEVNTRQTLQRYLDVRRQLAQGDPAAEANLLRNIAPGPDGRRQMPALVFDNRTLFYESLKDPPLLQGILQTGRWRCVLCDTKVDSGRSDATPILDGAAVFLASDQAEKLGLPAANTGWLELAIACRRRAGG